MKLFRLLPRGPADTQPIPAVRAPVAYLVGPAKLRVDTGRLVCSTPDGRQISLSADGLETVVCYGDVTPTADALALMARQAIDLALLSADGQRCLARLETPDSSKILARLLQFRALDHQANQVRLAQQVVLEKLHSQRGAARHYQRQGRRLDAQTLDRLDQLHDQCRRATTLAQLRGLEGAATAAWFALFRALLKPPWQFKARVKRPPADPVNALLSLGYTLLLNRARALTVALGFEPALGALHEFRPGRPSLCCDLIEPLRVPAVDRWVVLLCNQRHVKPDEFVSTDVAPGGIRLAPDAFPRVLAHWHKHWHDAQFDLVLDQQIRGFLHRLRQLGQNWPELQRGLNQGGFQADA
jgi:CRISPR-associated protein Cas1